MKIYIGNNHGFGLSAFSAWTLMAVLIFCAPVLSGSEASSAPVGDEFDKFLSAIEEAKSKMVFLSLSPPPRTDAVKELLDKSLASVEAAEKIRSGEMTQIEEKYGKKIPAGKVQRRINELYWRKCRLELIQAELYLQAARSLEPKSKMRAEWLKKASDISQDVRTLTNFGNLPIAHMGYILDARAKCLSGKFGDARKTLEIVLEKPKSSSPMIELYKLAMLENLEIDILDNPARAAVEAEKLKQSTEFKSSEKWKLRLDWIIARAMASQAQIKLNAAPDSDEAKQLIQRVAKILRDDKIIPTLHPVSRLALLAKCDELYGGKLFSREELLAWSALLHLAGQANVIDLYTRAYAMEENPLPPDVLLSYAWMVRKRAEDSDRGKFIDLCDEFLASVGQEHEQFKLMTRARASVLIEQYNICKLEDEKKKLVPRLVRGLKKVLETDLPDEIRSVALRQIVAVKAPLDGMDSCDEILCKYPKLSDGDAYLSYVRVANEWEELLEKLSAKKISEDEIPKAISDILGKFDEVISSAEKSGMSQIQAHLIFVSAQAKAWYGKKPSEALEMLREHRTLLDNAPSCAAPAGQLRIQLMMDLGRFDDATEEIARLEQTEQKSPADVSLTLAQFNAKRYSQVPDSEKGKIQSYVIHFCSKVRSGIFPDDNARTDAFFLAARALLDVKAHVDAMQFLNSLKESKFTGLSESDKLECSLMAAESLLQAGKNNDALGRLQKITSQNPKSFPAKIALGKCLLNLKQPAKALDQFRGARKLPPPGSENWARATILLAESLRDMKKSRDAADILRVSDELYPKFANAQLRAKMKRLREELEKKTVKP